MGELFVEELLPQLWQQVLLQLSVLVQLSPVLSWEWWQVELQ